MNSRSSRALREYVRSVLTEDEAGGNPAFGPGGDLSPGMIGPYGISFGGAEDLHAAFIQPFTDVFKTGLGKSKELVRSTRTLVTVAFAGIVTSFIPFIKANVDGTFEKEKKDLEKIRTQYKDVYDRTAKAFQDKDAAALAFMVSPGTVLTYAIGKMTAPVAKEFMAVVTGGYSEELYEKIKKKLSDKGEDEDEARPRRRRDKNESYLREGKDDVDEKIIKNKKFIRKSLDTDQVRKMTAVATKLHNRTMKEILERATHIVRGVKDLPSLMKALGKDAPADLKKKVTELDKLPADQKTKGVEELLSGVRKITKEYYVKTLESLAETVVSAGVPKEAQYVKDCIALAQKIKSL